MRLKSLLLVPILSLGCSGVKGHSSSAPSGEEAGDDGTDDGTGNAVPNTEGKGLPSAKGADSVTAFKATVYPLATEWCAKCHAKSTSPFFASEDVTVAHEAVIVNQKVDFQNVEASRLYQRLTVDHHNCPPIGCDAAAVQMKTAIQSWIQDLAAKPVSTTAQLTQTATNLLGDAQSASIAGINPDGVILLEAGAFTLKAPMAATDMATIPGGKIIATPTTAVSVTNVQTATASTTLGTAITTFTVKTAGSYRIQGLVNGAAAANASFFVRLDNGVLSPWVFAATNADYVWSTAATAATGVAATQFTLTAGTHTLEIRQRQAAAKIARVVVSSVPTFDPSTVQPAVRQVKILTFDLSDVAKVAGAKLTVEVADYSQNAYLFKNPTLVVPTGSLLVKDLRLLINGEFNAQNATYTNVDETVAAPGKVLSPMALVAMKDKGPAEDQFSFAFGTIEAK